MRLRDMDEIQRSDEYRLSQAILPLQHQRDFLRYITEISSSLRLHMDVNVLLKRVATATCEALQFRYSALYLADEHGLFHMHATSGLTTEQEVYLQQHPLPENILTLLLSQEHRISRSYLIPSESPIWQNQAITDFFVIVESHTRPSTTEQSSHNVPPDKQWQSTDLLVVPLMSAENTLLGFLTPDAPLDNLRPTSATMELLEAFANQAAIVIEGTRLYEQTRRMSEERAALIEELHSALEQAQESEKLKNHFLLTASHELRTPLTAVQGYLELLSTYEASLSPQVKTRFVMNAQRATEELVLLLSNVMDTSRIDQDHVQLSLSSIPLKRTVQAILDILEPALIRERRNVEVAVVDGLFVLVDDLRLRQILMNIMTNALKYTPVGTPFAINAISVNQQQLIERLPTSQQPLQSEHGQFVLIALRDWGDGILSEDQERLFTKFVRLPNALRSAQRGAGLGLYLCRQLTETMGGRIWVESSGKVGEGSTFWIAVPQSINAE